jgi:hypothetical protein
MRSTNETIQTDIQYRDFKATREKTLPNKQDKDINSAWEVIQTNRQQNYHRARKNKRLQKKKTKKFQSKQGSNNGWHKGQKCLYKEENINWKQ